MPGRLSYACAVAIALLAGPAGATTVRSLGVRELAARSELIFEGRVQDRAARANAQGAPETCVRFQVLEVLKGPPVSSPLELCFAGGSAGGRTREIAGMHYPAPGERGVYFVDSLAGGRVHPLRGWDQGRFLVREGTPAVMTTAAGDLVRALDPASEGRPTGPSEGVARGALLAAPGGAGMTPDDFKARVRALVAESAP